MSNRLKAPDKYRNDVNVWVDEAIWGHRFYNDQTPWLVLLEFLAVFRSRNAQGKALKESFSAKTHESFSYTIPRLIPPRELIFNNPHLYHIQSSALSNSEKWDKWLDLFSSEEDYSDLKQRFNSFERFFQFVDFYRTTSIEPHRKRRWTSRFLFPYGPNCLYADLPTDINKSPDRRFFGRSGELLYLMLNRSGQGEELAGLIDKKLLRSNAIWNRAVNTLLPRGYEIESKLVSSAIGYLPFAERVEYSALADTWLNILSLDLSGEALYDPLMRLSSLHILLYMLKRANEEVGDESEPKLILEIASPNKTSLFELSKENFGANRMLSSRAVRAFIESAKKTEKWEKVFDSPSPSVAAKEFLSRKFEWRQSESLGAPQPEVLFDELLTYADKRHQQHFAKVHMEWARQIGLIMARRGVGTWYSPSDSLLKALVICVVDEKREEFHRFLAKLYDRFKIIIGAKEAEIAFGSLPADQNVFIQNTQRLEQRLRTLGLLHRLSDDCAYVKNPFRSDG